MVRLAEGACTLPAEFEHKTIRDVYDDLDLSMRYVDYWTGMPHPVVKVFTDDVRVSRRSCRWFARHYTYTRLAS